MSAQILPFPAPSERDRNAVVTTHPFGGCPGCGGTDGWHADGYPEVRQDRYRPELAIHIRAVNICLQAKAEILGPGDVGPVIAIERRNSDCANCRKLRNLVAIRPLRVTRTQGVREVDGYRCRDLGWKAHSVLLSGRSVGIMLPLSEVKRTESGSVAEVASDPERPFIGDASAGRCYDIRAV